MTTTRSEYFTRQIVLTTGGKSYPGCGTTGVWICLGSAAGTYNRPHSSRFGSLACSPRLEYGIQSGLTLPDVGVQVIRAGRGTTKYSNRIETHSSSRISDIPAPQFSISAVRSLRIRVSSDLKLLCDWLPDLNEQQLRVMIATLFISSGARQVKQWLATSFPNEW